MTDGKVASVKVDKGEARVKRQVDKQRKHREYHQQKQIDKGVCQRVAFADVFDFFLCFFCIAHIKLAFPI